MSKTLMRHPDRPERVISIPLNEWARYRRSGYEFCNEATKSPVEVEEIPPGGNPPVPKAEKKEEPSSSQEVTEEEPSKGRRRTTAKEE